MLYSFWKKRHPVGTAHGVPSSIFVRNHNHVRARRRKAPFRGQWWLPERVMSLRRYGARNVLLGLVLCGEQDFLYFIFGYGSQVPCVQSHVDAPSVELVGIAPMGMAV